MTRDRLCFQSACDTEAAVGLHIVSLALRQRFALLLDSWHLVYS